MKWIATVVIAAAAAFGFYREVVPPSLCNVRTLEITRRTSEAAQSPEWRRTQLAHENLNALEPCLDCVPELIQTYATTAQNAFWTGDVAKARAILERALQYDRRPETYMQLGVIEMQQPETAAAGMKHMELACRFANDYVQRIPYEDARNEINGIVYRREMEIRAKGTSPVPSSQ